LGNETTLDRERSIMADAVASATAQAVGSVVAASDDFTLDELFPE